MPVAQAVLGTYARLNLEAAVSKPDPTTWYLKLRSWVLRFFSLALDKYDP